MNVIGFFLSSLQWTPPAHAFSWTRTRFLRPRRRFEVPGVVNFRLLRTKEARLKGMSDDCWKMESIDAFSSRFGQKRKMHDSNGLEWASMIFYDSTNPFWGGAVYPPTGVGLGSRFLEGQMGDVCSTYRSLQLWGQAFQLLKENERHTKEIGESPLLPTLSRGSGKEHCDGQHPNLTSRINGWEQYRKVSWQENTFEHLVVITSLNVQKSFHVSCYCVCFLLFRGVLCLYTPLWRLLCEMLEFDILHWAKKPLVDWEL